LLIQQLKAPSFFKRQKKFFGAQKKKKELWLNKDVYKNDRCSSTFLQLKLIIHRQGEKLN
jgi:hypothetical protein